MKSALMVAEKPSLASSLAKILSDNKASVRKGLNNACSVYEWKGKFKGETINCKMTSVCGHVMSLDFIGKYNVWDKVDPVDLFSCPTEKKEANPKLRILTFLAQEAKNCDYLILWLDCDKEGENICFEVMNAVSKSIQNVFSNHVTYRAKFSAITEKDIKNAFLNLSHPNQNESKSVDARQEIDLRIGCAFTRFQTKLFQGRYGDLDASLISYGPCQTPTLGFCVKRHDNIQIFKHELYWYIEVAIENSEIILEWGRGHVYEKDVAVLFLNRIKDCKEAVVKSVTSKGNSRQRPLALNTVELMKAASSGLGLGPHTTMQIAERLYTQGYISYPRTETTQYPKNFDTSEVVKMLMLSKEFEEEAKYIYNEFNNSRNGVDTGDHPPITPMKCATRSDFDSDTWRVFDYICRHFLATVSTDLQYNTTTTKIKIKDEYFITTTNTLIDAGFTKVMTWQAFGKNSNNILFNENDIIKLSTVKLIERQTQPPDYLTESELITLMEQHGIGTDASIPVHINNICQRNYVTIGSGRRLIPTTLGTVLVHGYQKIDAELVLPTMRSEVEKMLNLIAQGSADYKSVLTHAIEIFRMKFVYFVQNVSSMDNLFEASFSSLADSGKSHSRCGKCRRYMKYIQSKPARLYCFFCDDTYSLPNIGTVRVYRELKCPLDDFELLAYSSGVKGKSYPLCPYCYNHPPFPNMTRASGCNQCSHPTCPHSMITLGVCTCIECERGVMVLDCTCSPKCWKLGCNVCDVFINIFKDAIKITIQENCCVDCGTQIISVLSKPDKKNFKDITEERTGCLFCLPDFARMVERHRTLDVRTAFNHLGGGNRRIRGDGVNKTRIKFSKDKMAQLAAYFV